MVEKIEFKEEDDKKRNLRKFSLKRLFLAFIIIFFLFSIINSIVYIITPKIEVIPIKGVISSYNGNNFLSDEVDSRTISEEIYNAADDSSTKAILIDINSPGGSPVASEEISKAIDYAKSKKKVYSVIGDVGASGAYWVAASTEKIYVSPMSLIGSIGVTGSGLSFEDFIKEYNITYRRLVSGKYKDMGTPFRKMTEEEKQMFQNLLDEIHNEFIKHVAKERNLSYEYVKNYSNGEIFLGKKAIEIKLADYIGNYNDVIQELKKETKADLIVVYSDKTPLQQMLQEVFQSININLNTNLLQGTSIR